MKFVLLLSLLAVHAYGQIPECFCGAFVTLNDAQQEVLPFPPIDVDDCTQDAQCSELCLAEWNNATNGGDLCTLTEGGYPVADDMCTYLSENGIDRLQPETVYLYYNLCAGPWQFNSVSSQQQLECKNGTSSEVCLFNAMFY